MLSRTVEEARRVMGICNACRYCEGYCAVFPTMELRTAFSEGDLAYLANLCHDCRGCYYACPYAPPHEFAVNVPRTLATLRAETYRDRVWPRFLAGLLERNGLAVAMIATVSVTAVVLLTLLLQDAAVLLSSHRGEGAFYTVIPFGLMVLPASAMGLYAVVALLLAGARFWQDIGGTANGTVGLRALARASRGVLKLTYLGGGGHGCNYPDERFSLQRKRLHHLVFYGFLLDLASTTVAAFYHHLLRWDAPYPIWSLPVVLGTVGGVAIVIGTGGLLWLKRRSDPEPADRNTLGMDVAFLALLNLTSLTGLLLLALRETPAMGTLLAVHLGMVAGLFLTLPYGKFVHAVFRCVALVRFSIE